MRLRKGGAGNSPAVILMRGHFLEAEWRRMAVANYSVDPASIRSLLPDGLEPDLWEGKAWLSLAGLQFVRPRAFGLPLPFHGSFAELNLRTYVRVAASDRRGLVFLGEIVSSPAIALGARLVQNKAYACAPIRLAHAQDDRTARVQYSWSVLSAWNRLSVEAAGSPFHPEPGSAAEFFTQHYRGFGRSREGRTVCFKVDHPPWRIWDARAEVEGAARSFDERFAGALSGPPVSAYLAEGSAVRVSRAEPV